MTLLCVTYQILKARSGKLKPFPSNFTTSQNKAWGYLYFKKIFKKISQCLLPNKNVVGVWGNATTALRGRKGSVKWPRTDMDVIISRGHWESYRNHAACPQNRQGKTQRSPRSNFWQRQLQCSRWKTHRVRQMAKRPSSRKETGADMRGSYPRQKGRKT